MSRRLFVALLLAIAAMVGPRPSLAQDIDALLKASQDIPRGQAARLRNHLLRELQTPGTRDAHLIYGKTTIVFELGRMHPALVDNLREHCGPNDELVRYFVAKQRLEADQADKDFAAVNTLLNWIVALSGFLGPAELNPLTALPFLQNMNRIMSDNRPKKVMTSADWGIIYDIVTTFPITSIIPESKLNPDFYDFITKTTGLMKTAIESVPAPNANPELPEDFKRRLSAAPSDGAWLREIDDIRQQAARAMMQAAVAIQQIGRAEALLTAQNMMPGVDFISRILGDPKDFNSKIEMMQKRLREAAELQIAATYYGGWSEHAASTGKSCEKETQNLTSNVWQLFNVADRSSSFLLEFTAANPGEPVLGSLTGPDGKCEIRGQFSGDKLTFACPIVANAQVTTDPSGGLTGSFVYKGRTIQFEGKRTQ